MISGWVKTAKEVRKNPPSSPESDNEPKPEVKTEQKDVTCEILQNRMSIFRTFLNFLKKQIGRLMEEKKLAWLEHYG